MVVMLDGTDTILGPQVAPALFGYLIGVACAVASFLFGRHVYDWWVLLHPQPNTESLGAECAVPDASNDAKSKDDRNLASVDDAISGNDNAIRGKRTLSSLWKRISFVIGIKVAPFILFSGLVAAFAVGDAVYHIPFYRKMWMSSILAPCGAILRWKLSKYNASDGYWRRLSWVPWGTFTANITASIISILAEALEARDFTPSIWVTALLPAIETGFAGSLSTVATLIKEMVNMKSTAHMYIYTFGTILVAMLVSLLLYMPIMRTG